MSTPAISVRNDLGEPTIVMELPLTAADDVLAALARDIGGDPRATLAAIHRDLHVAVDEAIETVVADELGCEHLAHGAETVALTSDAVLGSTDGGTLAVLLPGEVDAVEAASRAVALLAEHASHVGLALNLDDPDLTACVGAPDWFVLHACAAADHEWHPQIALDGPATPGAILVTRVDIEGF